MQYDIRFVLTPLFTMLLAIVILKGRVGLYRCSAPIIGFIGIVTITHPGIGRLTYGANACAPPPY